MFLGEMRKERVLSQQEKILLKVVSGDHDRSMKFHELQKRLYMLGFQCRVKGDHFIYWREDVDEIINIQPDGNMAKPYQVRQIRNIILKYGLEA